MANIIIISDREKPKWQDWLSKELVKRGHLVFEPEFPKKSQNLNEWIDALKDFRKHLGETSIMVGHGAGRAILLKILEEKLREITGAVFLSGKSLNSEFENFTLNDLDFKIIKEKSKNFFIYASEQDDNESMQESEQIANLLDDEVMLHDNTKYFKKDELFEDILIDILSIAD
ncbi:MAG: alpha/beta hydrolase [Candidatus Woesearchaeota archaeon]